MNWTRITNSAYEMGFNRDLRCLDEIIIVRKPHQLVDIRVLATRFKFLSSSAELQSAVSVVSTSPYDFGKRSSPEYL